MTLQAAGHNRWTVVADPDHESANAMYGGWTLAVLLQAVEAASADEPGRPASISASFVRRIDPGAELGITVRLVGGSRSVRHWAAEAAPVEGGGTSATASAVLTADTSSDGRLEVRMPAAPDPESVEEEIHPPGSQGQQVVLRPVRGFPAYGRPDSVSITWIRDRSDRPLDYLTLAYLADNRAPRCFFWSEGPRPSATLTMSVYFHATREELARVGEGYLLSEAFGVKGAWSTSEEHHRLWSRTGDLLATSEQLARYR